MKISKELLCEVLNEKVEVVDIKTSIDDYSIPTNEIRYYPELATGYKSINIYEFAFKCKEWAIKSNNHSSWELRSFCNVSKIWECHCNPVFQMRNYGDMEIFKADTEFEAIIKACEWILEKKD